MRGRFVPSTYAYWPGQSDYYGDQWPWLLQRRSMIAGEWVRIGQSVRVNDCVGTNFQRNAQFDGFMDGLLACRHRDFMLRTTDKPLIAMAPYNVQSVGAIGRIWLNAYHGGTSVPKARCSFQVRNVRVAAELVA